MNPKIKKLWIAALKSGKYKQTKKCLQDAKGYCCLGVLCDLHANEMNGEWIKKRKDVSRLEYVDSKTVLPDVVRLWADLKDQCGLCSQGSLANLNDEGVTFPEIAKIIQKEF